MGGIKRVREKFAGEESPKEEYPKVDRERKEPEKTTF